MTQKPVEPQPPPSTKPFNRLLLSQGRSLPPTGTMRVESRKHLVTQERLGVALALLVFYGVVYGARLVFHGDPTVSTRGDFVTPLYFVAGLVAVLAVWSALASAKARTSRRRRKVRYAAGVPAGRAEL